MTPRKPAGRPARLKSRASAPAHPLSRSPVRSEREPPFGPGRCVVLYLHSPREKHWGFLLQMDLAGLWLRGIELESFDAWAREQASNEPGHMGLTTFFVPFLRVDKVVLDERVGPVPSLKERFETITGRPVDEALGGDD
jgi:hypothetical protein